VPLPLASAPAAPVARNGRLCVAYLGHASRLKGFHILPDVIKRTVAAKDPLQCYGNMRLCADLESACKGVPAEALTLVRGAVDPGRYRELMASADIVLLPYVREFYGWASSGIFAEAMSAGKVVIATEGTWPAAQLAQFGGGGITVKDASGEAAALAVRTAAQRFPELKDRAIKAMPAWNRFHSAAGLVDKLLALAA
jgi:glycosyltransferase involved in cell wall biosynthesis